MTSTQPIDAAIDRLQVALEAAGLSALVPADADEILAEIAAAISPYALPADLARFWERVRIEPDAFPVSGWTMGALSPPVEALEAYRLNIGHESAGSFGPPLLFPVARHAETQWSVELQSEWAAGGVVVSHLDDMRLEYPSFTDLVEVYAEIVEERAYLPGPQPALLHAVEQEKQRCRLDDPTLRLVYGPSLGVSADPAGWPAHWLASAGIDPDSRIPLGATHTVAELVSSAREGRPAVGRIHGEIVRLDGVGRDCVLVIDDGTGQLAVSCPAGTSPWGPIHRQRVELDVTIGPHAPGRPPLASARDLRPLD